MKKDKGIKEVTSTECKQPVGSAFTAFNNIIDFAYFCGVFNVTGIDGFLFLSIFTVDRSSAQIIDRYKTNSAGKVTIDQVVQVDSTTTADQLYIRAKKFMTTYWKSAKDVTQLDDKESGIITTEWVLAKLPNRKIN